MLGFPISPVDCRHTDRRKSTCLGHAVNHAVLVVREARRGGASGLTMSLSLPISKLSTQRSRSRSPRPRRPRARERSDVVWAISPFFRRNVADRTAAAISISEHRSSGNSRVMTIERTNRVASVFHVPSSWSSSRLSPHKHFALQYDVSTSCSHFFSQKMERMANLGQKSRRVPPLRQCKRAKDCEERSTTFLSSSR